MTMSCAQLAPVGSCPGTPTQHVSTPPTQTPSKKRKTSSKEEEHQSGAEVLNPGPHDVLLGRGSGVNNHVGNINFRQLVGQHKNRCHSVVVTEKPYVAREVVKLWKEQDPPGRFLTRKEERKKQLAKKDPVVWVEVPNRKAQEKTSQCLRERTHDLLSIQQTGTWKPRMDGEQEETLVEELRKKSREQASQLSPQDCSARRVLPSVSQLEKKARELEKMARERASQYLPQGAPVVLPYIRQQGAPILIGRPLFPFRQHGIAPIARKEEATHTVADDDDHSDEDDDCGDRKRQKRGSIEDDLVCPLSLQLPVNPVTALDGRVYERSAIEQYFQINAHESKVKSPVTQEFIGKTLMQAPQHRNHIETLIKTGVIKGDLAKKWIQKAKKKKAMDKLIQRAEQGDAESMFRVGRAYLDTRSHPPSSKDLKRAFKWFEKAHLAGSVRATTEMALMLLKGFGVAKNEMEGVMCLSLAAGQGSDEAAYFLGLAVANGKYGLPVKKAQAIHWMRKALSADCRVSNLSEQAKAHAQAVLDGLQESRTRAVIDHLDHDDDTDQEEPGMTEQQVYRKGNIVRDALYF